MLNVRTTTLQRILTLLLSVLICKIVMGVLLSYRDYMPPNFESDFLQGRAHYFFGRIGDRTEQTRLLPERRPPIHRGSTGQGVAT